MASPDMMNSILKLIRRLKDYNVDFVIIGGVAATLHGLNQVTFDLDLCAPLDHATCVKIISAVSDLHPKFRSRPDLPVVTVDNPQLHGLKNLYLRTDAMILDILGDVAGVGDFAACLGESTPVEIAGEPFRVLKLESLIHAKRAAGRPKDLIAIPALELILNQRKE